MSLLSIKMTLTFGMSPHTITEGLPRAPRLEHISLAMKGVEGAANAHNIEAGADCARIAQAGSRSAAELIKMAERTVSALQPSAAATYAEPLFSFLQQALDVRQSAPAADTQTIERAAVSALVALVMKLNEKQFKPLFLRLHAWSTTHPAGQPGRPPSPCKPLA